MPKIEETVVVLRVIRELKTTFFVRRSLDEEHALRLAELLENGTELPPILITPTGEVIDGRHRMEAHELTNRKEIRCRIVNVQEVSAIIAMGYKANTGGSLPPKKEDTEHTIELLLLRKVPKRRIAELLELPMGLASKYVNQVEFRLSQARLRQALRDVSDGVTVEVAAKKNDVEVKALRQAISGRTRKISTITELKKLATSQFRSNGANVRSLLKKAEEEFNDGNLSAKELNTLITYIEKALTRSRRLVDDWKNRITAKQPSKK